MTNFFYQLQGEIINLCVAFGEIEVSKTLLGILIFLTTFTFLAVGISSYKLIQSVLGDDDK